MIINHPLKCTHLPIWSPKYSTKYDGEYGERVALLHKNKVDFGTPILIVEFTKAKHLAGQRFAITKEDARQHKVGSNGVADMYEIPMSHLSSWATGAEIIETANSLFNN